MDLTAAQLLTFRTDWVPDLIEDRAEWGASPLVDGAVLADANTIAFDGLGSGSILAGTEFVLVHSGIHYSYHVTGSDVAIVAGEAAVTIRPRLRANVANDDPVYPKKRARGAYAQVRMRTYFTDAQLQELAGRAETRWMAWIATQQWNRQESLFTAMRLIAYEQMLADGSFVEAVNSSGGDSVLERMRMQLEKDRRTVDVRETGAGVVQLYR